MNEPELIISNLKALKDHPGWKIIEEKMGEDIARLEDMILLGVEEETYEKLSRLRDKLAICKNFIDIPNFWIERLKRTDAVVPENSDPYYTKEEIQKIRESRT